METEILLTEEAEPPGTRTCLLDDSRTNEERADEKYTLPVLLKRDQDKARNQVNSPARDFRRRFFPQVSNRLWNDWTWQLANRLTDANSLSRIIPLSEQEKTALATPGIMPLSITPYFAGLIYQAQGATPLRRTVIPLCDEYLDSPEEKGDPLEEERHTPVPGIIHRYPDRVLFFATGHCATYCRYCTRSRMVGQK
ncbi:MAG: hypothetical protein U1C55_12645, partial [Smithellaceae bacterium]|nr:hypothetical protein [Smithellaceae bacterium]